MKERPILFSAPMVRAILADRKTVTRRLLTPQPDGVAGATWLSAAGEFAPCRDELCRGVLDQIGPYVRCPYGRPGDRLWVREGFAFGHVHDALPPAAVPRTYPSTLEFMRGAVMDTSVWYRCDVEADPDRHESWVLRGRWRSPLHMPRWAARITLNVTSVRVERLHDITEKDAKAEGVDPMNGHPVRGAVFGIGPTYREGFAQIWHDIHGAESWDANPWVWRVEFWRSAGGDQ